MDTAQDIAGTTASSRFSPAELAARTLHRRAVEAVIWGIPIVNTDLMYQAAVKAGAGPNQIVYWSRLFGWQNQTLTPNPDSIYFMPFYDTKAGPIVLEIPPAEGGTITGSLMDYWQAPLEDVGPAGVDKGKGGKYLILPPGYQAPIPDGYIPMPSLTYVGYALLRSILKSGSQADLAAAVAYGKTIKLYPLANAANPPETTLVDAIDVIFDAVIPYDLCFFQSLARMVEAEPWIDRDRAMIDTLRTLGIEKGKPFKPDTATGKALETAAQEAQAWFDDRYETTYAPYNDGPHWFPPADKELLDAASIGFTGADSYPLDSRGTTYYFAFSGLKHMGAGQFYLFTCRDKDGDPLDGGKTYRLRVPVNPPVHQYWSATAYDFVTHALIRDTDWSSRSSNTPGLQANGDGSVDVFFGPEAPAGKDSNWVPTKAGGRFEGLFRFYGPDKPLFDKTWVLPDIEKN